jgi:CAAX prenyl protease-like protein
VPAAAAAYLAPRLATLATALVTSAWSSGPLDRLYALRVAAGAGVLVLLRAGLPRLRVGWAALPVALGAGVAALWVLAAPGDPRPLAQALAGLDPVERWAWIAARVAGSCAVIPVVEELTFRGFLLPWLAHPDFERAPATRVSWPALALSSLAFGSLHHQWILGTVAGAAFAVARQRRGRLGDAILAHAVANLGIALAVLLGGRWELWG